jgi:hypothetical protein
MANGKKGPYIVEFVLIARNSEGKHVSGMGSKGNFSYAKRMAQSLLRVDLTGTYATVEVYRYCSTPWQDLQPMAIVTLDDESEVQE